jgi:hypothetical protein
VSAKIRFLLDQTESPHLSQAVQNLQYKNDSSQLTDLMAKNCLMSAVHSSQDYNQNEPCGVASMNTNNFKKYQPKKVGFKGKKFTKGKIPTWGDHIRNPTGGDHFKLCKEQQLHPQVV